VVQATGEYRMSDHDTRADALQMTIEAAKRDALEQVATYLESVTEVKNMEVTRDDIRTYTAGIVMVLDQQITTRLEGETVVIHADLTAQVDSDEVVQAIQALRENESAKTELAALRTESDQLQQQLDAANRTLATAVSSEQVQELNQQRQELLNQMEANAYLSQAWTTWGYVTPVIYPSPWSRLQHVHGLLSHAQRVFPRHRHLSIAQQTVGTSPTATLPPSSLGAVSAAQRPPSLLVSPAVSLRQSGLPTNHSSANFPVAVPPQTLFPEAAHAVTSPNEVRTPRAISPQTLLPGTGKIATNANTMRMPGVVMEQPFSLPGRQQVLPPHFSPRHSMPRHVPSHSGGHEGGSRHAGGGHHSR